jgi:Glycosyltransferase family 87
MLFPWYLSVPVFLLPFVDFRRPFRLFHLDLLVLALVGIGSLQGYVTLDQPEGSIAIATLGLGYISARLLWVGFHPRRSSARLVPHLTPTLLLIALVLVVGFRFGYTFADKQLVRDVGVASVLGADRIADGRELYGEGVEDRAPFRHSDTYGPVLYLTYVPFEQLFPVGGGFVGLPGYEDPFAGRSAAITFDVLVLLGLFLLGRRWRPGPEGRVFGLALAYAWASYPYSLFTVYFSFNDTLVTVFVLGALLTLGSPTGRGAFTALAAATKFGPAALVPLMATGTGERRVRSILLFAASFVLVTLAVFLPLLPDGGVSELYHRTLDYQRARTGWNSVWARFLDVDWLKTTVQLVAMGFAAVLAFVPRRRSPPQVAALGGSVMAATELTAPYWFHAYLLWFAPLAFAGLFSLYDCPVPSRATEGAPVRRRSLLGLGRRTGAVRA